MANRRSARTPQRPGWLQFTAVPDSIIPHHVPFPLVRRLHQICVSIGSEITGEGELNALQYSAVACLDDFPGIDQRHLAALMGVDRTNVGQILDQLEKRGLVDRRTNGADRRARVLRLTRAGETLRRRIRPKLVAAQAGLLAPLSPAEQDMLIELLTRVVKANEAHARPGAGRRRPRKRAPATVQRGADDQERNVSVSRRRDLRPRHPDTDRTG